MICAPFTLEDHAGLTYVVRHGQRIHVAAPETVRLWAERDGYADGSLSRIITEWGYLIRVEGEWYCDPAALREVAEVLRRRAEMLEGNGHEQL